MSILLALLAFSVRVLAAPIPAVGDASDPAPWLAVFLAFFTATTLLVLAKQLYLKKRRALLLLHSECSASSCIISKTSTNNDSPLMYCPMSAEDSLSAFCVGSFGSPVMEITVHILHKDARSVFSNSIRSTSTWKSRSFKESTATRSSSKPSNDFGEKLSDWPTTSSNTRSSKSLRRSDTILSYDAVVPLPTAPPTTVAKHTSKFKQLRRSSLPVQHSKKAEYDRASLQKRHSSLRSSKGRRPTSQYLPASSSVRVVEFECPRDTPLPLSPSDAADCALKFFQTSPTEDARRKKVIVPPVPTIPPPSTTHISRPYRLMPRPKQRKPMPGTYALTDDEESPDKVLSRSPPIPQSTSSLDAEIPSTPASPHPSMPIPPLPVAKRSRTTSHRSPTLGPSPLRIMTLPEASLSDLSQPNFSPHSLQRPAPAYGEKPFKRNSYSQVGLGFPPSDSRRSIVIFDAAEDDKRSSGASSNRLTIISHDDDPNNVLLGFIRDLVEETSNWDASLYMDSNFRNMLDNAPDVRPPSRARVVSTGSDLDYIEGLEELNAVRSSYISDPSL